jgi:mediator of RNA polymerase II transcription subunit 23
LLLSNLPDVYSEGLTQRLVNALLSPPLSNWNSPQSVFQILNLDETEDFEIYQGPTTSSAHPVYLLALAHSLWHHCGESQIRQMSNMVRDKLIPVVRTEEQLIFAYHLVGPFLQRLHSERCMRPLFDITINLYKMLAKVDKETQIKNIDAICDILYHVKYQFTGDTVKLDAEKVVMGARAE